jgi:DNA-binding response OmpR family regulator
MIWILDNNKNQNYFYTEVFKDKFPIFCYQNINELNKAIETQNLNNIKLLITELYLPDGYFFDLLEENKKLRKIPYLISSSLDQHHHVELALKNGALDYLIKPLSKTLLLCKIEKLLSLQLEKKIKSSDAPIFIIQNDELRIVNTETQNYVDLTPKELKILNFIKKEKNQVATRSNIIYEIWGNQNIPPKSLDVHLFNLRKKLRAIGLDIIAVKPQGFTFSHKVG